MADWYVSSTAYAAIPTFTASHAYSVGDIIRPTSPTAVTRHPQRCTTAGTSGGTEPSWNASNNGTTSTGTATFTNVAGQSAYGWSAPAGALASISWASSHNITAGDRVFVSSDHVETNLQSNYNMYGSPGSASILMLSVNKAGSVPPVAADLQSGASISVNSSPFQFEAQCPMFWQGFTFTQSANGQILFNASGQKPNYLKNCALVFSNASGGSLAANDPTRLTLDNTTLQVASTAFKIDSPYPLDLNWINTPSLFQGATLPSSFINNDQLHTLQNIIFRGVDLSALTGTLVAATNFSGGSKVLFEGCKINSSATRYGTPGNSSAPLDEVEFVNCYDSTSIFSERYVPAGKVTTDTSTYMTGGATDDVGNFSHKMVSNSICDAFMPLESFWFDVENTATGSSKTATVELVSSASLNNTDIKLQLEYQGTSGSSVTTIVESLTTVLDASAAVTTSTASWNSPPSTPVYQKLQITFTPQQAGRVRARVILAKASKTLWVNPQVTIT